MLIRVVKNYDDCEPIEVALLEVPGRQKKSKLAEVLEEYWDEFMEGDTGNDNTFEDFVIDKQPTWRAVAYPIITIEID